MDPEMVGAGARGVVGLAYCWDIVSPFLYLFIVFAFTKRAIRFLNTVEERIISIDQRLGRLEDHGIKTRVLKAKRESDE